MIVPGSSLRVIVAVRPVDFRRGAEGLAALVRETMKTDPFSSVVYVFRAKRLKNVCIAKVGAEGSNPFARCA